MDNEASQDESLAGSGTFDGDSPYDSDDSRLSPRSYDSEEYPTEVNSYEWLDDTSYDTTQYFEGVNIELGDSARDEPVHVFCGPQAEELGEDEENTSVETLEENNNDPNNNMDSNEVTNDDEELILMEQSSESGILMDRTNSPQPGCSKDSLPVSRSRESPPTEGEIHERIEHVLQLVASIDANSVSKAIRMKPRIGINDVKLWDLVPKPQRSIRRKTYDVVEDQEDGAQAGSSGDQNSASVVGTVKRGPIEDICTIGAKKSSSSPDVVILETKDSSTAKTALKSSVQNPVSAAKSNSSVGIIPRETLGNREKSVPAANVFVASARVGVPIPAPVGVPVPARVGVPIPAPVGVPVPARVGVPIPAPPRPAKTQIHTGPQNQGARPKQRSQMPVQQSRRHAKDSSVVKVSEPVGTNNFAINPVRVAPSLAHSNSSDAAANPKAQTAGNQPTSTIIIQKITQNAADSYQQPTNRQYCKEMYYKLRNMFTNVDPKYLKKLCPPEWGPGDRDAQVTAMVEYLLSKGDALPPAPIKPPEDEAAGTMAYGNVDVVYENLLGIFPDADPHYLREFAENNVAKPNAIKEFVELKLESRDYPTKEQYRARLKITEQQRQYTTGFNVQQFLTIIPDPHAHFMDPKKKSVHSTVAFEFLKSHFCKNKVMTISRIYEQKKFNLTASAEAIELLGPEMKTRRGKYEMPTENILLLQEIAYVKHRNEINEYIENQKKAEEAEFKMLKENNFLVECQCCYDSECIPSKCSSCDKGHLFCNKCIVAGTNTTLGDGGTRISCFLNCGSEIGLSVLQQVLAPTTFSILLKKRQAAEVMEAGLEGLVSCPFCNFASIPPEDDKIFKCLNPECTKESCRLCKELSHVPLKCNEVLKAEKARLYIEESMTAALARKCYRCQRAFFKEEGCNKIQCPCGALMCYLCDQPIQDYKHFRGQGSNDKNLCPLYSDTIRLDAVAVRKIAEEAQKKVMKENPNIKIDTSKLLPDVPNATAGPHTTVMNADELPLRTQRVLDRNPL